MGKKISEAFCCLGFNIIKMCRLSCRRVADFAKQPFDSTGWLDYDNQPQSYYVKISKAFIICIPLIISGTNSKTIYIKNLFIPLP